MVKYSQRVNKLQKERMYTVNNAGVTALDGTELREIVYKVGANRVATIIGDGGFEESVYES